MEGRPPHWCTTTAGTVYTERQLHGAALCRLFTVRIRDFSICLRTLLQLQSKFNDCLYHRRGGGGTAANKTCILEHYQWLVILTMGWRQSSSTMGDGNTQATYVIFNSNYFYWSLVHCCIFHINADQWVSAVLTMEEEVNVNWQSQLLQFPLLTLYLLEKTKIIWDSDRTLHGQKKLITT